MTPKIGKGFFTASLLLAVMTMFCACGNEAASVEYTHNADAYFAEDWSSSYSKVVSCKQSPTHGSTYVEIWVSNDAKDFYGDEMKAVPKDGVLLKAQYSDAGCTTSAGFTAMKKLKDEMAADVKDWGWQRVEADGSVSFSGDQPDNCSNCHSDAMQNCPRFICDKPE